MFFTNLTRRREGKILFTFILSIPLIIGGMLLIDFNKDFVEYPTNLSVQNKEKHSAPVQKWIKLRPFKNNTEDHIRINLPENKISVYKNSKKQASFNILTKGDPQKWGGTPAGEYKIQAKHKSAFSAVSSVFMPWAIKFYGKYYIHGQPYYYTGLKLSSDFSGGCLRLSDKEAKSLYSMTNVGMPVLVITKKEKDYSYTRENIEQHLPISAKSYLVADLESGFIFDSKNISKVLPIASITKLMTATIIAEQIDLRKTILVKKYMLDKWGTREGLKAGERVSLMDLTYRSLAESSNNAASVLGYFLGEKRTVELMNEKAGAIFMENTNFVGSCGLKNKNISTVKDLFYLAHYILNNRTPLLEISRGKEVKNFGKLNLDLNKLWNKNIFIEDNTFLGGKTGFTDEASNTGLFIFQFEDRKIAIIILGSDNLKWDTQKLYIWLKDNYFK